MFKKSCKQEIKTDLQNWNTWKVSLRKCRYTNVRF